jgi:hypothetical protein
MPIIPIKVVQNLRRKFKFGNIIMVKTVAELNKMSSSVKIIKTKLLVSKLS